MPQQLLNVMSSNEIIQYINENPNLNVNQLKDLASRVDISNATDGKVSVLYTGIVDDSSANGIAKELASQHSDIGIIDNTQARILFESTTFNNALENAITATNPSLPQSAIDEIVSNELFKPNGGMWSIASENLASRASGDVVVILSPDADADRVFAQNELPKLLNNNDVDTINGIDKNLLKNTFDTRGVDAAMNEVKYSGGAMLSTLEEGLGASGDKVFKTDKFFDGIGNIQGDDFPQGTASVTKYADSFEAGGVYNSWWDDTKAFISDSPSIRSAASKLGVAGDVLEIGIVTVAVGSLLFASSDARAAGNIVLADDLHAQAVEKLSDWMVSATEGAIGGAAAIVALNLAGAALAAAGIVLTAPAWIATAFTIAVVIAGGIIAEDLLDLNAIAQNLGLSDELFDNLAENIVDFIDGITSGINTAFLEALGLFDQAKNFILMRSDPILLDMDSDGLELTSVVGSNVRFDINNNGIPVTTGWVSPDDALLAMDDNGNGTIDNLNELFGNNSIAGFAELTTLDSNLDGKISNLDTQFNNLKVWQDLNQNGISEAGELWYSLLTKSIANDNEQVQFKMVA